MKAGEGWFILKFSLVSAWRGAENAWVRGALLQELRTNELGLPLSQDQPKTAPLREIRCCEWPPNNSIRANHPGEEAEWTGEMFWVKRTSFCNTLLLFGENDWLLGKTALFERGQFPPAPSRMRLLGAER
jgi:hypothetical protein